MHLRWDLPGEPPLIEVGVDLTVVEPPTVASLYFWALQVGFVDRGRRLGAAHMGLQHHPRHPGNGAVNWGGYRDGGGELDGSGSILPSALGNVNSRDYRWEPGVRYRYTITRSPDRGWRASITDTRSQATTVIRDLWVDAEHLSTVLMWSEVFADCDAPTVRVEWSGAYAVTTDGTRLVPRSFVTSYQRHEDGGCANTDAVPVAGDGAIAQVTNTQRRTPPNTAIPN